MGVPKQVTPLLVKLATTLNVEVSGVAPALVAMKEGIFPIPEFVGRPIASFVRLQENMAPGTLLVNTIEGTVVPAQYVWLATALTCGFGLTVIVN